MTHVNDNNNQPRVLDRVDDSEVSLADPIPFLASEFLTPKRARIIGQTSGLSKYSRYVIFWDRP
jgi:hypothetical protein